MQFIGNENFVISREVPKDASERSELKQAVLAEHREDTASIQDGEVDEEGPAFKEGAVMHYI